MRPRRLAAGGASATRHIRSAPQRQYMGADFIPVVGRQRGYRILPSAYSTTIDDRGTVATVP